MKTPTFIDLDRSHYDDSGPQSTRVVPWLMTYTPKAPVTGVIGFMLREGSLRFRGRRFDLIAGMYFAAPGAIEAGTAKVSKRIESLHWLQDNGYRTFGMVCPSLPQLDYESFAQEAQRQLRYDRLEHVWAEPINVRGDSFTRTIAALREAGLESRAARLEYVSTDKHQWELYARWTYLAHRKFCPVEKLRFLQYVAKGTEEFWSQPGVVRL